MGRKPGVPKGDQAILQWIRESTKSKTLPYYIAFIYEKSLLPNGDQIKTYEDLQEHFPNLRDTDEIFFKKELTKESVQKLCKELMKRLDGKRDVELLNKYYQLAMSGDVQALKAYMDFKKVFFAKQGVNELTELINNADIDDSDDDDFEMIL